MTRNLLKALMCAGVLASAPTVVAQTGISASNGGFENATSTFAANGWTEVTPSVARQWRVGTAAGSVAGGTKAAYVGAAANFNGANGAQVGHFYRDVVVPAGATGVALSFSLLMPQVDDTFDFIRVFTTTTSNTPVSGTSPGAGYTLRFSNTATVYGSFTTIGPIDLTALAGTTIRLVFTNVSDGVAPVTPIAIDNVTLNYVPNTPCSGTPSGGTVPAALAICPNGTTTINSSGAGGNGSGVTFQWEEFSGGIWVNVVGGSGATTTSYTTPVLSVQKQYHLKALCTSLGGGTGFSNTCTVTPTLSPACYCAGVLPSAAIDDGTGIRNVTFNTINNTSNGGPAYTSFVAVQTTVNAGQVYPLSVSVNTAGAFTVAAKAWFDWNQNAVFEAGEEYSLGSATNGNPLVTSSSPLNITVPGNALGGATTMRVRAVWDGSGTPLPCGSQDYSEAEDFTINVVACNPPTASLNVVDDCANNQFSLAVDVATYGSGTQANLIYTVNGGAPVTLTNIGLAPISIGPFASTAVVAASVNNGPPGCAMASTQFYSSCPIVISCGTTMTLNHCYQNNDPRTFHFVSSNPNETLTLTFVSGNMASGDVIRAYSGADNNGDPIDNNPFNEGNLTGNFPSLAGATGTSNGNELFVEIDSDASGSCADGNPAASNWTFEVECTAGCVDPDGSATVNTNCLAYNFSIDVEVSFTGDAGTTTLRYTVNGGLPTDIPGLVEFDIQTIGPFAIDDIVNVRLLHESDGTCDKNLGNFTDNNTCPTAENCVNALNLGTQTSPLPGTTVGRTNDFSFACGTASANTAADAIYYIDVPNGNVLNIHQLTNNYDSQHYVRFGGTCPGTTVIACIDDDGGETAYVTWTNTTGSTQRVWWIQDGFGAATGTFTLEWTVGPPVLFPLATCAQNLAIPDPGCADATFTITGQPNNLGGNVGLESVDIILTHTFRSDLTITLQAPGGQILDLIVGRGGSNNNFGNNTNCPTAVFKLRDNGAALSGMPASNNTTGAWAPEQPLAGLTGNPNGTWVLRMCDDFTPDPGALRYLNLNFLPIDCNSVLGGTAMPGTACNDANACTINDTWSVGCVCAGTFQDTDGDAVCDASDNCPGTASGAGVNAQGCSCAQVTVDDGIPCTLDECTNSTVTHTLQDGDADGVCDGNDNCPGTASGDGVNAQGCSCAQVTVDDGDPCTLDQCTNGVVTHDFQDGDNDGVCDANDNCPGTAGGSGVNTQGCSCAQVTVDDGDPCTLDECLNGVVTHSFQDADNDGICDANDNCPNDPANDADGDGICGDVDECPNNFGEIGDPCEVVGFAIGALDANCECIGAACTTNLAIEFQLDGSSIVNWEIRTQGSDLLVQNGTATLPLPGTLTQNTCVPDGCYYLVVTDNLGDGITSNGVQGGYILRTTGTVKRLIDNRNNFISGTTSQIAGGQGFCVPIGNDRLITAHCDRIDLQRGANAQCSERLTADNTPNNTSGNVYQFWVYNPNGPESQLIPATGAGSSVLSMNQVTLPAGKLYNVKVRTRISPGVWRPWGAACRMSISAVPLPCRLTMLVDDLTSPNWSCGKTVTLPAVGGGNGAGNLLVAKPATRLNANCVEVGANKYQFRFTNVDNNAVTVVNGQGSNYFCYMTQPTFAPCQEFLVEVHASFDGGLNYCAYSGKCSVFTGGCNGVGGPNSAVEGSNLSMYPNPNRGDQLFLTLDEVAADVSTVSVDIYDSFGKRVSARTMPVADGFINTVLELNGELAAGVYLVNITAGDVTYTERLAIQP